MSFLGLPSSALNSYILQFFYWKNESLRSTDRLWKFLLSRSPSIMGLPVLSPTCPCLLLGLNYQKNLLSTKIKERQWSLSPLSTVLHLMCLDFRHNLLLSLYSQTLRGGPSPSSNLNDLTSVKTSHFPCLLFYLLPWKPLGFLFLFLFASFGSVSLSGQMGLLRCR